MKKMLVLMFVVLIAGCGFEPLYTQRKSSNRWYFSGDFDASISAEMAQIKVEPIAERFGQMIRNNLLDSLSPLGAPSEPRYRLRVEVKERRVEQQALREDITATRERIRFLVNYSMEDNNYEELVSGDSIAFVSYDILANPYSTTTAKKKAEVEAAKIIADDISLRVGAFFHSKLKQ